ncbi:RNB domain-containing ribonuclease [Ideonella sp. DXS29W]|uniref:RNB domain-containing ribonuclease n=1 Tax=Ideonella lacteola TaxID=2984193 RepID=A0ABU9BU10_9BURK
MDAAELERIAALEMQTHGLRPVFDPAALHEAEDRQPAAPAPGSARGGDIRDTRDRLWFSIDNDDTQDLDQLSWAEALPGGQTRLAVAVADVDALVAPGGAIDEHASINTTSVYTAAGVFPMLPTRLSNDLTSLHEGQDRLAVVVEMTVSDDGSVIDSTLYRAVVLNRAKLAYDSIAAWLDGRADAPAAVAASPALQQQLALHDRVARSLRHWRTRRGALNVMTAQARPVFADGQLVDLRADRKNRAKDLIADLMIAANGATARHLVEHGQPSLRRVLQEPKRWDRLVKLAAEHGATLPAAPNPLALDEFLTRQRQIAPTRFEELSLSVVKLLGSGAYAAAQPGTPASGHFGLAVNDYAHSTAPNRRFVDLVTQRLIKASLAGRESPYTFEQLGAIAAQCTAQEDNASTVERRVLKAAAAFLLHDRIGEVFDAIVTGVTPKGTFVRIFSPLVEGRVVRGFDALDVGDSLRVKLCGVDIDQRFIDFEPA